MMIIYLVLERWGGEFISAYSTRELAEAIAGKFDTVVEYDLDKGYVR
jgi:hypothetical protein